MGATRLGASGPFKRIELEIAQRTPLSPYQASHTIKLPNGIMQLATRGKGGAGAGSAWSVSTAQDEDENWVATIRRRGRIYDNILGVEELDLTLTQGQTEADLLENIAISENDVLCVKYTYSSGDIGIATIAAGVGFADWEPYEDDAGNPATITAGLYPIAKIINVDDVLRAELMATSHIAKAVVCYNGTGIQTFTPI